uniref:Putative secreted protein n=1 Tax=Anopheles marajoara TaxID=58244 RepID=A0A2M4CC78_9DIPT
MSQPSHRLGHIAYMLLFILSSSSSSSSTPSFPPYVGGKDVKGQRVRNNQMRPIRFFGGARGVALVALGRVASQFPLI